MSSQLDMYKERQSELVQVHNGKIIAVRNGECLGEFVNKTHALTAMLAKGYAPGTFLIIRCTEGEGEYTRRFRSRVTPTASVARAI